jgi:excisionase family DNA binding protein
MNKPAIRKRLYTIKETAYYLGRSPYAVRELIWGGELPVIKREGRGSKMWIDIDDLERYCENKVIIS